MRNMLASSWVTITTVAPRLSRRLQDKVVKEPCAYRIEAGGGLIKKQDIGIERHSPG